MRWRPRTARFECNCSRSVTVPKAITIDHTAFGIRQIQPSPRSLALISGHRGAIVCAATRVPHRRQRVLRGASDQVSSRAPSPPPAHNTSRHAHANAPSCWSGRCPRTVRDRGASQLWKPPDSGREGPWGRLRGPCGYSAPLGPCRAPPWAVQLLLAPSRRAVLRRIQG